MRFPWLLVPVLAGTVLFRFAGGAKAQNPTGKIDATYQNGVAALKRGDLASARTAFEKIIKLAPQIPEAHNSLGWVLLTQGDTDNAIVQFRTALKLKPAFVQAHINLANALSQKKNLEEAAAEARTAVTIAPKDSEAHRTLGRVLAMILKARSRNSDVRSRSNRSVLICTMSWARCWHSKDRWMLLPENFRRR